MIEPSASSPHRDTGIATGIDSDTDAAEIDLAASAAGFVLPDAPEHAEPAADAGSDDPDATGDLIDLDAIERDLTDVQTALDRLDDGSYWTDEVTGDALPDEVLASFPLTRSVAGRAAD